MQHTFNSGFMFLRSVTTCFLKPQEPFGRFEQCAGGEFLNFMGIVPKVPLMV